MILGARTVVGQIEALLDEMVGGISQFDVACPSCEYSSCSDDVRLHRLPVVYDRFNDCRAKVFVRSAISRRVSYSWSSRLGPPAFAISSAETPRNC